MPSNFKKTLKKYRDSTKAEQKKAQRTMNVETGIDRKGNEVRLGEVVNIYHQETPEPTQETIKQMVRKGGAFVIVTEQGSLRGSAWFEKISAE